MIKKPEDRKTLLCIAKKTPKSVQEFLNIRGDSVTVKEDFDCYKDSDKSLKIMKKKKSALFIHPSNSNQNIILGRSFDNQFLDLINFKLIKSLSSADFPTVAAEVSVKYFLLFQNIKNERLQNFFTDLLCQKSYEINLSGVKYAWIINQNNNIITLKFVRVMKDYSVEDIGPYFELEIESEFYCGEDLWKLALDVKKGKKVKNVEKNVFKDKIGKIHIDRQDLHDIKLKKSRGYKENKTPRAE